MTETVKKAFITSIPVMAGYIVLGMGFGILMNNAGFGMIWCASMSVFVFAGALQYVGVGLLQTGASVLTVLLTSLMINARHVFYGVSMLERYRDAGKFKPYLIYALTDETYSLLCGEVPDDVEPHRFRFFVSLFNQSYWILGSILGNALGSVLPFSTAGVEFSMTALFIAAFTEQWLTAEDHLPAVTGLAAALLCLLVFGRERFLIPSMLLISAVLLIVRKRREAVE